MSVRFFSTSAKLDRLAAFELREKCGAWVDPEMLRSLRLASKTLNRCDIAEANGERVNKAAEDRALLAVKAFNLWATFESSDMTLKAHVCRNGYGFRYVGIFSHKFAGEFSF